MLPGNFPVDWDGTSWEKKWKEPLWPMRGRGERSMIVLERRGWRRMDELLKTPVHDRAIIFDGYR